MPKELESGTYWNYAVKLVGQDVECIKGVAEPFGEEKVVRDDGPDNIGKYSTLEDAIQGFLYDELNDFSKVTIEFDEKAEGKFKLVSEVWLDVFSQPTNDVVMRKWRRGEIKFLQRCRAEARFICHEQRQASLSDYSQIMDKFARRIEVPS